MDCGIAARIECCRAQGGDYRKQRLKDVICVKYILIGRASRKGTGSELKAMACFALPE